MHVLIDDEVVATLRDDLENVYIDTKEMGLTDNMLKKIILTYYKTTATTDTIIYMPVEYESTFLGIKIDEELVIPLDAGTFINFSENYTYFWGNKNKLGENGVLYIGTRGIVEIYNDEEEKMTYYDMESLKTIITDYKKAITDDDAKSYIASFEETFKSVYTISEGGMGSIGVISYSTDNFESTDAKVFDYRDIVSDYSMSIEFMIDILNLTASPDFVDEISNLVNDSKIELRVNANVVTTATELSYSGTVNGIQAINMQKEDNDGNVTTENILKSGVSSYTTTLQENTTVNTIDYTLTLKSVDCWWCKAQFITEMQSGEYYLDEDGNKQDATCQIDFTDTFEAEMASSYSVSSLDSDTWLGENIFAKLIAEISSIDYKNDSSSTIFPVYTGGTSKEAKKTINIKYTDWKQTTQNVEFNVQPFIELLKKEYKDLYNSTTIPGDLLCNGDEMLFELLEMSPYSAKHVDVMKYILYKYSGIDYGVDELNEEFLSLYDTQESVSLAGLMEYLNQFEQDHSQHLTEEECEKNYNQVERETMGLDLSRQQKYALTYIVYTTGNLKQGDGFVKVYRDAMELYEKDSYEFNMYLWDNYWYASMNTNKVKDNPKWLQNRDAAFETYVKGTFVFEEPVASKQTLTYYTEEQIKECKASYTTKRNTAQQEEIFTYSKGVGGGAILDSAKMVHDYMSDPKHLYYYCLGGSESSRLQHVNAGIRNCGLTESFEGSKIPQTYGYRLTCCAGYVSWVLKDAGLITVHYNSTDLRHHLKQLGWERITNISELEPGDVVFWDWDGDTSGIAHVNIYVGDGCYYDAGSNDKIHAREPYLYGTSGFQFAYRQP